MLVEVGLTFVTDEVRIAINPIRSLNNGGNGPIATVPIVEKY